MLNKIIAIGLISIVLVPSLMAAPSISGKSIGLDNSSVTSDWTVMVYMCGDNDLQGKISNSINWLEYAGSDESVNIVVQADYLDLYDGVYRYYIKYDTTGTIISDVVDILEEQNTGNSEPLSDFVIWAADSYPAEKYCLILWGHGSGWAGFLRDDTSVDDMKLDELKEAMTGVKNHLGRKIDLISFEPCLLGMIEVYYQIRGTVDVCVGSEDVIFGNGFPYHMIYPYLKQNPDMSVEELAEIIIDKYTSYYWRMSCALGAFYSDKISILVEGKFTEFAGKLSEYYSSFKRDINKAIQNSQSYNAGSYITYSRDLFDFADEIINQMELVTGFKKSKADELIILAEEVISEIDSATIYSAQYNNPGSHGISIYIPTSKKDYDSRYENTDFCINTNWDGFITQCLPRNRDFRNLFLKFPIFLKILERFQTLIMRL